MPQCDAILCALLYWLWSRTFVFLFALPFSLSILACLTLFTHCQGASIRRHCRIVSSRMCNGDSRGTIRAMALPLSLSSSVFFCAKCATMHSPLHKHTWTVFSSSSSFPTDSLSSRGGHVRFNAPFAPNEKKYTTQPSTTHSPSLSSCDWIYPPYSLPYSYVLWPSLNVFCLSIRASLSFFLFC